jgi:hypothetical protein
MQVSGTVSAGRAPCTINAPSVGRRHSDESLQYSNTCSLKQSHSWPIGVERQTSGRTARAAAPGRGPLVRPVSLRRMRVGRRRVPCSRRIPPRSWTAEEVHRMSTSKRSTTGRAPPPAASDTPSSRCAGSARRLVRGRTRPPPPCPHRLTREWHRPLAARRSSVASHVHIRSPSRRACMHIRSHSSRIRSRRSTRSHVGYTHRPERGRSTRRPCREGCAGNVITCAQKSLDLRLPTDCDALEKRFRRDRETRRVAREHPLKSSLFFMRQ